MISRILLLVIGLASSVCANDGVRYYIFDETKTETLHYEHVHDVTIYDFTDPGPRLVYYTEFRVYGCKQPSFTYTTERFERDISPQQLRVLSAALAAIDLKKLEARSRPADSRKWTNGWLDLKGTNHHINESTDAAVIVELRSTITKFLDSIVPPAKRKSVSSTVEGETVPAMAVTFESLLRAPEKYDQKRVRLTGYWHHEFEGSNFGPAKGSDYKQSIWLGGPSTFADPKLIQNLNDADIVAEGTFEKGPGGHMGLWPGELSRLTLLTKTKK